MPDASPPPPLSSSELTKGPKEVHPAFREFLNTHSSPAIRQYLANNPDLIDPDQRLPKWLARRAAVEGDGAAEGASREAGCQVAGARAEA